MVDLCPHCKLWHDGRIITRCLDDDRWTKAERDELREQMKRRDPAIRFAPSTARMQDLFGARNRADAQAASQRNEPFGGASGDTRATHPTTTADAREVMGSSRLQQGVRRGVQAPALSLQTPGKRVQPDARQTGPQGRAFERSGANRGTAAPELGSGV
jgi:hypothetical protein